MPNSPASRPVTIPAMTTATASQTSSVIGTPSSILFGSVRCALGPQGPALLCRNAGPESVVRNEAERFPQQASAYPRRGCRIGEPPAERPRAGHGLEQSMQVARDGMKPGTVGKLALDI